ncbi:mediator of RNA polymerase II transcription subunit 30 isoform X2 [Carassius gibelio]|uniref:mediator of RNA polymerase II transcription subunit 30 isoform X2 n=1 Tax=Carassius gibelio TaxID=101364 RepID=UPI0022797404|nr:mediator of RNA polymerase II transcription subunit 30 isoform X2 [Carassius gibelio]
MTTPPLAQFPGQQAQAARDVNTASLCRIGQETVQDIVLRTMEIFQLLRNMQLPNGVTYHPNTHQDRLGKLQEHLRMLSVLFRKLRLVYDKCNENCAGLDPIPPELFGKKYGKETEAVRLIRSQCTIRMIMKLMFQATYPLCRG